MEDKQEKLVMGFWSLTMLLRRLVEAGVVASLFGFLVLYVGLKVAMLQVMPLDLSRVAPVSPIVVDRQDCLLRAFTTPDDRWRLPVALGDVTPKYIDMLLAYEDRRFYRHKGVDFPALLRATWQAVTNGRIVSGGSTLTMQVARLISGHHARDVFGKFKQMVQALQLERQLSKTQILDLYLRLAPFGGNLEGVRAASLAYFGKEPGRLSLGESALLVALPQSPEARRPDRHSKRARQARDKILMRAERFGVLSSAAMARALLEKVPDQRRAFPMHSPHLADLERAAAPTATVHRTTLDRTAQASLQSLVREQTRLLGDKLSASLLAIDNATGEVIAYVGSPDYLADKRHGPIDMVQAIRSPGSTLKPFIYGMAFESGLGHPETLIEDRRVRFGNYSPENFDDDFHGTVTLREALGQSLNIPAVKLLHAVGPLALVDRFRKFDVTADLPDQARPSLAVALGGVGMRMLDLGKLYTGLARGGLLVDLSWRRSEGLTVQATPSAELQGREQKILSDVAAWYVTDILKDAPVPTHTKAGRIAYKTGTSYGYRDAWAAGYDGRHTIVVWVGRPDAVSTPGLVGRTAAAPILFSAFERLASNRTALQVPPKGALRVKGSDLPPPLKRFRGDARTSVVSIYRDDGLAIAFPPDRTELDMTGRDGEPLVLKAAGGVLPLTWLVDGVPIDAPRHQRSLTWTPEGNGFVNFSVVDANGQVDRVHVRLH